VPRVWRDPARVFRATAIAEALSWLGLLTGMFFKYLVVQNPVGVKVFGPVHGALFVAYLAALLCVAARHRWGLGRVLVGAAAAVPPFTSVVFERWAARRDRARSVRSALSVPGSRADDEAAVSVTREA
jgi:integral membrane protein